MATDLIMPRLPDQQQLAFFQAQNQQQHQLPQWHQQPQQPVLPIFAPPPQQQQPQQPQQIHSSAQISPLSTSGNASPTSPKAYHTRQIRPLYMPAVLRPTEHPSKPTPARAKPENEGNDDDDNDEERTLRSNSSFINLGSALGRLSRRSTGDSGKCVDGNWNLDMFPQPTGMPTREHWKPDHESTICDHSTCRRTFSYFTRRHHCRRCGNIFCDLHSAFEVPLDEGANFNPRGVPVRACAHCYGQFKQWRSRTATGRGSGGGGSIAGSEDDRRQQQQQQQKGDSPLSTSPIGCKGKPTSPSVVAEVAVSVPRDWNWSTF